MLRREGCLSAPLGARRCEVSLEGNALADVLSCMASSLSVDKHFENCWFAAVDVRKAQLLAIQPLPTFNNWERITTWTLLRRDCCFDVLY